MSRARRAFANRLNARKSTGPRTAAGKAAVARNARRHGLSVPLGREQAIERMIRSAEARRDEMLRQLHRHQAELAERLRNAAAAHEQTEAQVLDVEVAPAPVQTGQYPEAYG